MRQNRFAIALSSVVFITSAAVASDHFATPTQLEVPALSATFPFDTFQATTDTPRVMCGFSDDLIWEDVWYDYRPARSGPTTITVCGDSSGRVILYNELVAYHQTFWTDEDIIACAEFVPGCDTGQAQFTLNVVQGQRYRLRIGSSLRGMRGSGEIHIAQKGIEYRTLATPFGQETATFPPTMDGGGARVSGVGSRAIITVQVRRVGAGSEWDGIWTAGGSLWFREWAPEGVPATEILQPLTHTYHDPSGAAPPVQVQGGLWPAWVIRNSGRMDASYTYGVDSFFGSQGLGPWTLAADEEWVNLYSVVLTLHDNCARPIEVRFEDNHPRGGPAAVPLIVRPDGWPDTQADYTVPHILDGPRLTLHVEGPVCPPCPCERTGDAPISVDLFDLLAYNNEWFSGAESAELTGDDPPQVDVFDLLAFLNCWLPTSAGVPCP